MQTTQGMNFSDRKENGGYTMIEMLVVLSILAILFGVGYANFRDFSRRQVLFDTSKMIQGDLRIAQQLALSGKVPADTDCTGNNFLHGYQFRVVSSDRYQIQASCSGGYVGEIAKEVILPASVTIATPFPAPNPILFKVLGSGTNISGSNTQITLTQAVTGITSTITITASGQIQ